MNRIFKSMWNAVRQCYVAVNEATGCKQARRAALAILTAVALGGTATQGVASSSDPSTVVGGGDEPINTYATFVGLHDIWNVYDFGSNSFKTLKTSYVSANNSINPSAPHTLGNTQYISGLILPSASDLPVIADVSKPEAYSGPRNYFSNVVELNPQTWSQYHQFIEVFENEATHEPESFKNKVFIDREFNAKNTALVFGNDSGAMGSAGFVGIKNAQSVTVKNDGKQLTLIGKDSAQTPADFVILDAIASVKDNGTLTLGSKGLATTHRGKLQNVNVTGSQGNQATVEVVAGQYQANDISLTDGRLTIAGKSEFTLNNLDVNGRTNVVNDGKVTVAGNLTSADNANLNLTNNSEMTVQGESHLTGNVNNNAKMTLVGSATVKGTVQNAESAKITANTLHVAGTLRNVGEIEAKDDSTVEGVLENTGLIKLFDTDIASRGEVNNTYTLKGTGKTNIAGLLKNAEGAEARFEGDDSHLTVKAGGQVLNQGTLIAERQTVEAGGSVQNGTVASTARVRSKRAVRSASAQPTEYVGTVDVQKDGTKTNSGKAVYGQGTVAGTFVNTTGAEATFGKSDTFPNGQGLTVAEGGKVTNDGRLTLAGHGNNQGTMEGNGTLTLAKVDGADNTFTNAGTISTGTLEASNVTYTQTAGRLTTENGWFDHSAIQLTGGELTHETLGEGNAYTLGSGTGGNDQAKLTVGTLTSDSTVEIKRGSTLRAEKISMTGEKTTKLVGGRLSTTLDQVFGDVSNETLNLDAKNPEDKVNVESNPSIVSKIGEVIESVGRGISFGYGTVAFDDAVYDTDVSSDALDKLNALADDHEGQELEVAFTGSANQRFNVDLANRISAKKDGQVAYATFAKETLLNESEILNNTDATALVMGSTDRSARIVPKTAKANQLNNSMGFKNITGAQDGVYVNSGKHLVLVGDADGEELADGKVFVGGNRSKLTLGSYGSESETKGHLAEVNVGILPDRQNFGGAGGQLIVKNGQFKVDTVNNGSGGYGGDQAGVVVGNADDRTASLETALLNIVDGSTVLNDGVLKATNITSTNTNNTLTNRHELTSTTADINGTLVNYGKATVDSLTLHDAHHVNGQNATLSTKTLTIAGDELAGADQSYDERGGLANYGTLTSERTVVGGLLKNAKTMRSDKLVLEKATDVANAKAGQVENSGELTVDVIKMNEGTSVTNAKEGTLNLTASNEATTISADVVNEGTMNVTGNQVLTVADNGNMVNRGSFTAQNLVQTGGKFTNEKDAELKGLTINGGLLSNSETASLTTTVLNVAMDSSDDVAIENAGVLVGDIHITKGIVSGGTIGVNKNANDVQVDADGSLNVDNLTSKTLTNDGKVDIAKSMNVQNTVNRGLVNVQESGKLTLGKGDTFSNETDGSLVVKGTLDLAGALQQSGFADIATLNAKDGGLLAVQANTHVATLQAEKGSEITATSGVLSTDNLQATQTTYNQRGGSITVEKGWFDDSTLNIESGVLDARNIKDSMGNVTGDLGHNVINISGTNTTPQINNDDSSDVKSHYKDNLTQVIADHVTSETQVNIKSGGVLDVEKLALDGKKGTIALQGGVLQTSADQIFDSVTTSAIRMDAKNPEEGTVELDTQVLASTTVGNMKDSVKSGLDIQKGNLALDDEWYSASLIVSVADKIAKAVDNASNLTVNFLGNMTAPFTVTTANELESEGLDVVLNPGVILNTMTLHNEMREEYNKDTDASQSVKGLVIGGTSTDPNTNVINLNIGFKDILHANRVTVDGGKSFALVGSTVDSLPNDSYGTDEHKLLLSSEDGGRIDVVSGNFTFGSDGSDTPTVGWINASDVGANGTLTAKNGEFADWTIKNDGNVHVQDNAILHTHSYSGKGSAVNDGKVAFEEKDGTKPTLSVDGTFTNNGELNATKVDNTTVAGNLTNNGTASYDDMTVAKGGESINNGTEKGDILTVAEGGSHTNTGTSIWNNQTVDKGAVVTNEEGAKETFKDAYVVNGDKTNKGEVDATGVENTQAAGHLTNDGKSTYDDMTVSNGGVSDNHGFEQGDILTIADGGKHTNTGTSIWNNQTVDKGAVVTNEEGAKETFNDGYVVNGDKTNKGEVDATGVENTQVAGNLTNDGKSMYDDMTINDGGVSDNHGYEKGDILTVADGGTHNNTGTSIWNNVVVDGGDSNNTGSMKTDTLTMNDGVFKIGDGDFSSNKTDLNGGDLVIGNDKDTSADNRVIATLNPEGDTIDTNIYVKNNGDLNLGRDGGLDWADSIGSPKIPETPSRLVVTGNVTTGEGGGIAVGKDVWRDKDNHVQIGNGDLYFAHDSVTVIDSSILTDGKSAFSTKSDKAKVTVEKGATLILGNITTMGDYTIVNGYKTGVNETNGLWTGGWTFSNLLALPDNGTGLGWLLTLHHDASRIWVNAMLNDVRTLYPDIVIPNIGNDALRHCDSGNAGDAFVCGILRDTTMNSDEKTKVINSVAQIAFAGGTMAVSMNDMNTATDSVEGRVSMGKEAFHSDGTMREIEMGHNLWIDAIGGHQSYDSLSATGIDKAGFKTDAYGFVMGYDHKLAQRPVILGGAISVNRGDLKSTGDVLATTNKYDSYGLHAYGAWSPSPKLNVIGTLSYMNNSSDVEQTINKAGFRKAEADVKTNMVSLGVRAESHLKVGKATVIPHAGLRYTHAKSSDFDTKVDGKTIWNTESSGVNTFQMPIGVSARADIQTKNGWTLRPHGDVSIVPNFGNTKQSSTIKNVRGVSDGIESDFAGKFGTSVKFGLQADKGNTTFGVNYGFMGSDKGKADHTVKFELRHTF